MRVIGGAFLVGIGLLLFYLISTGKLAAALAAWHVLSDTGGAASSSSSTTAPSSLPMPSTTPQNLPPQQISVPRLTQPQVPMMVSA